MRVIGFDPGTKGALALWDTSDGPSIQAFNLPRAAVSVGGKSRTRLDEDQCWALVKSLCAFGCDLFVYENVSGYGNQPGSAGFVFGDAAGLIRGMFISCETPRQPVSPAQLKNAYGIKGETKAEKKTASRIVASRLFPESAHLFSQGVDADKAEAGLLAHLGATKFLGYTPP